MSNSLPPKDNKPTSPLSSIRSRGEFEDFSFPVISVEQTEEESDLETDQSSGENSGDEKISLWLLNLPKGNTTRQSIAEMISIEEKLEYAMKTIEEQEQTIQQASEMGNRLLQKVRELNAEKEVVRKECDQLQSLVQFLKRSSGDRDILEKDILILQASNQALHNEKKNLLEKYDDLKYELKKATINEEGLKSDLLDSRGLIQTYERSNKELKAKVDRLTMDNEYLNGSIQSSNQLFLDESAARKKAEAELARLKEFNSKLLNEKSKLQEELEKLTTENIMIREESDLVRVDEEDLFRAIEENKRHRELLTSKDVEIFDLQAANEELRLQMDEATDLLRKTQEKFHEMTALAERLSLDSAIPISRRTSLDTSFANTPSFLEEFENTVEENMRNVTDILVQIKNILGNLLSQFLFSNEGIENNDFSYELLSDDFNGLTKLYKHRTAEILQSIREAKQLQQKIAVAMEKNSETVNELYSELDQVSSMLLQFAGSTITINMLCVDQLKIRTDAMDNTLKDKLADLSKYVSNLKEEIEEYRILIAERDEDAIAMDQRLNEVAEENKKLKNEIQFLKKERSKLDQDKIEQIQSIIDGNLLALDNLHALKDEELDLLVQVATLADPVSDFMNDISLGCEKTREFNVREEMDRYQQTLDFEYQRESYERDYIIPKMNELKDLQRRNARLVTELAGCKYELKNLEYRYQRLLQLREDTAISKRTIVYDIVSSVEDDVSTERDEELFLIHRAENNQVQNEAL